MNYIVTKPMKSKGIAALLVIFFWPLGMFYSTIFGAIIMIVAAPLVFLSIVSFHWDFVLSIIGYFLSCFIWALVAVDNYNKRIQSESYHPLRESSNSTNFQTISSNQAADNKTQLFKDLETLNNLYYQKVITEEVFNKQKQALLNQLDSIQLNEINYHRSPKQIADYNYSQYGYGKEETQSYLLVWIIAVLLMASFVFILYRKGIIKIDNYKQDRIEITNQIEKTYFGIINGGYTAQGMQGVGTDGLPFYNMKMENLMAMGFLPLLNYFSGGINLEAKNIDVYKFINDQSAQVKYDVIIEDSSKSKSDTIHIDMVVKKIGGYWKLDGAKAFGDKNAGIKKEAKTRLKFKSSKPISINQSEILDKSSNAFRVKGIYMNKDSTQTLVPFEGDKCFLITKKNIYEIDDGNLIKRWRIKNIFNDHVDIYIINTYEGTKFYPDGFTRNEPSGEILQYDVEWLKSDKIFINKQYINE